MSATAAASATTRRRSFWRRLATGDEVAHLITFIFAASVFLVTVLLISELWRNSAPSQAKFGWRFLVGTNWDPVAEDFGALPFIYGTILTRSEEGRVGQPGR